MLYQSDTDVVTMLLNIKHHLEDDYDYVLIVCGDTGTGKSMFGLNLLDTWYREILKKPLTKGMIDQVNTNFQKFVQKFQDLEPYEMNIFDEGVVALDSKDAMTKFSKNLSKMFNVFRTKRFFTIIILPSFFNLNKYFRENRIRGLVWVNKRGKYKWYSKKGIMYLNAYNENKKIKSMMLARPIMSNSFPDYKGLLREEYNKRKNEGVDDIIAEVMHQANTENKTVKELYREDVKKLKLKNKSIRVIGEKLGIGKSTVANIINDLIQDKELIQ